MTADAKTTEDEKDPIAAALADPAIHERLLSAARAALHRLHTSMRTERDSDVEEVVSTARVEVWRRRRDYNPECDTVTWIVGFIFNVARDFVKKHMRHPTGPPPDGPRLEELAFDLGCPSSDGIENRELTDRMLAQLPSDDRQLIDLVYYEELTFAEIGERMGLSANTTRLRHFRLLERLRNQYRASGEVQS